MSAPKPRSAVVIALVEDGDRILIDALEQRSSNCVDKGELDRR
jgi:dihydroxyacid dehydratase/phosphogluconate dehydratase